MVAKKRTRKNVAEGVKFLRSANGQFAGSVGSGEKPPKKPRKPKAKAIVEQLDPSQKARLAKTLKEKYTVEQLKKKKVAELKELAIGLGAAEPAKYKNRKDSWIAEINKVYEKEEVKPKKKTKTKTKTEKSKTTKPKVEDMFGYTGEELSKMKVDELEVLAEKVGAATPAKYRNRRQSWLDELAKASVRTEFVTDDRPLVVKNHNYFLKRGKEFTDKYLEAERKPSARELAYIERRKELGAQIQEALANKQTKKVKQLTEEFHVTEERLQELVLKRENDNPHKAILNNILSRNKITREQALELAERVEIGGEIPPDDAKTLRNMIADYHQLTGGKVKTLNKIEYSDSRAFARDRDGLINIGSTIENAYQEKLILRATLYHEMGHHVEYSSKEVVAAAQQWRKSRAESEKLEFLSELTGNKNYDTLEKAYKDAWYTPYVGKYYSNGYTEVISMGIEKFAHPAHMRNLYEKDKEHYHFIIGVLTDDN